MHALPDDLRAALQLAGDEPVRHAAFSSYPSSRGPVETALVVTSRRVIVGECPPDQDWALRAHDRTAITALEIDSHGIREATVGLVAGDRVTDQFKVARLDKMDFEDAAPFVASDAERDSDDGDDGDDDIVLEPLPPGADLPPEGFDAPPTVEPITLIPIAMAAGASALTAEPTTDDSYESDAELIELTPIFDEDEDRDRDRDRDRDEDAVAAPGVERIGFRRVRGPEARKIGSRFRFAPNPASPGDSVIARWHLNWPRDKKVRGVHWELQAREHTSITVSRTVRNSNGSTSTRSTTYTESRRLVRGGGTLWGEAPAGFLSNVASGVLSAVGAGTLPVLKAGVYEWQEVIHLPEGLPPTYHGTNADVEYDLRAWIDLPMAFDHRAGGELRVLPEPATVRPTHAFWPAGKQGMVDHLRPEIELEVRVQQGAPQPGHELIGEVVCVNRSGKTVRAITVELQQYEYAKAGGHTRSTTRTVGTLELPAPAPDDDTPRRFTFRWPKNVAAYRGTYSKVEYQVAARVDVAWGLDVHCTAGLRFV